MPLVRYAGDDRHLPGVAPEPLPSTEDIALRDAQGQIAALTSRLRSVEAALQTAHRILAPSARTSR